MYLRARNDASWREDRQHFQKLERVVFPIPGDDGKDEFGDKVDQAVKDAEAFIRPHLKMR